MNHRAAASIRDELLHTFNEYHSSIGVQTALVDELAQAVRQEERERRAEVVDRYADTTPVSEARDMALMIIALLSLHREPA